MMKVASLLILGMVRLWTTSQPIDPPPAQVATFAVPATDLGRTGVVTDACLVEEEEEDPSDEVIQDAALGFGADALLRSTWGASAHVRPRWVASRSALPSLHLRC
jgi:hypothetical protein